MSRLPPLLVFTLALLLAPVAWGQTPNPDLSRARESLEALRYSEATKALEAARARPGNDRETLLQILELQGVVAAMLNQSAKARTAFQTLAVLAPEHQLTGDYAPRVVTPFFEAKGWVADQNAELRFETAPAEKTGHNIESLAVQATSDVLKLGRSVRFHLHPEGNTWTEQESPLVGGQASVEVKGERIRWWAELLDEQQAVLAQVGSAEAPLTELSPRLEALARALTEPVNPEDSGSHSSLRTASYALLGAAVGTGAAGGYFGWRSRSARKELEDAPVNEQGVTVGITQREAVALDERARSSAKVANILFGVAGATAIVGGTLWVLGAPVTVSAAPTGVTVGGEFP
ncbi:hypothetical protein [Hyalangium minutum]|uniref:Tetratricopeptide repeat domain protein n=1 Tax=Hyalangium minutum TaxID=394096 RepID=A0A085VXI8_9BACT|nr:hypothetical protein [Hyalangium minutum]KFE60151.1 hypothetical protein DB31_6022 [Hyalangium minutum]